MTYITDKHAADLKASGLTRETWEGAGVYPNRTRNGLENC